MNQRIHGGHERMAFTELTMAMSSVGAELLNEAAQYPYDPVALPTTTPTVVGDRNLLAPANTFGAGNCNPNAGFVNCLFVNDFHGKTATRTVTRNYRGTDYTVTYNATYAVRYVTEASPHTPTGSTKTFAKEIEVTVSSDGLEVIEGQPLQVVMSRIVTYPAL